MRPSVAIVLVVALCARHAAAQDTGAEDYRAACAVCHGVGGRGDGPMVDELMRRPADLTVLSHGNDGAFPYWRVFETIDGRYEVGSHGDREMPVWGERFLEEATAVHGPKGGESAATDRIHALAGYIQSLQR